MKPRLKKFIAPNHTNALWFCVFHGAWNYGTTAKEAYNKMAERWNLEYNWAPEKHLPLAS